jgi:hypothetical protein
MKSSSREDKAVSFQEGKALPLAPNLGKRPPLFYLTMPLLLKTRAMLTNRGVSTDKIQLGKTFILHRQLLTG